MKELAKRLPLLLMALLFLSLLSACNAIIETRGVDISVNLPGSPPPLIGEDSVSVSTQAELEGEILNMVRGRDERGLFRIELPSPYDIEYMVLAAIEQMSMEPLAAYATSAITAIQEEGHGYVTIEIVIGYQKTLEQITEVQLVTNEVIFDILLSQMLREGETYLAMLSPPEIAGFGAIEEMILDYYYRQALDIIVLPQTQIGFFPGSGGDEQRIAVIELDFGFSQNTLTRKRAQLRLAAGALIDALPEDLTLPQQIHYLTESLADTVFETLEEVPQADLKELRPLATTAFGALVEGSATSEGYAMAFKALMELLGVESHVIQGEREGERHVWNIVQIDGYYYHIDVSLLSLLGPEYTLFLSDEIMILQNGYSWDTRDYPSADGPALAFG